MAAIPTASSDYHGPTHKTFSKFGDYDTYGLASMGDVDALSLKARLLKDQAFAPVYFAQLRDLATGMQYRRVVAAAEVAADLRQRHLRQFLGERHRHLPRPRDRARALLGMHVRHADLVVVGDRLLDVLDRDLAVLHGQEIAQCLLEAPNLLIRYAEQGQALALRHTAGEPGRGTNIESAVREGISTGAQRLQRDLGGTAQRGLNRRVAACLLAPSTAADDQDGDSLFTAC